MLALIVNRITTNQITLNQHASDVVNLQLLLLALRVVTALEDTEASSPGTVRAAVYPAMSFTLKVRSSARMTAR